MSDAILDKVRKLLAKAEDPACTLAEAEAFNVKAMELMAKYGVDRALLAVADPGSDVIGDRVIELVAPYALDKTALLAGIADTMRCRSVRRTSRVGDRKSFAMHMFGFESDLDRVELLFTSVLVQASQALAAQRVPAAESLAAYRRSWLAGFTHAIVLRLRAAEERAAGDASDVPDGRSVALVLADRSGIVQQRLAEAYPRVRFSAPRRLAGTGMSAGYEAGQRADLGGTPVRGGSGRREVRS